MWFPSSPAATSTSVTHEAPIELAADRKRLSTIMLNLASDAARRRLETMMTTMEWKSDFIEGFVQEGLQKGMQQGMQQGAVKAKSEAVLKIIDARAIDVTAEQCDQVSSCTDIAQLDQWFDSALTAQTVSDIFKS
jgi:flagellar biosynthesis/type III secretory pathway protein FliH